MPSRCRGLLEDFIYHSLIARALRVRRAYTRAHGRSPNLLRPRRFTEKIQWRKIFDFNPVFPILCDKLGVRAYIAERVGSEHLIPLLWTGTSAEIPFDRIERPFFLKSTHSSGQVVLVGREESVDIAAIRARAERWLLVDHGDAYDEPGYGPVPPHLVIEETVTAQDGARPDEIRLFVFDGKVAVINTVFVENGKIRNGAFHTPGWTRLNWHFTRAVDREFARPLRLDDMIAVAERLGEGLDHVRVDIYDCGDRFWIGEMTIYSWSGYSRFTPDEADLELGSHWRMPPLRWREIALGLFRDPVFPRRRSVETEAPRGERELASKETAS